MRVLISNLKELAKAVNDHNLTNLQTANLINQVYGIIPLAHLSNEDMINQLKKLDIDNLPSNEVPKFGKYNPTISEILKTPFRKLI